MIQLKSVDVADKAQKPLPIGCLRDETAGKQLITRFLDRGALLLLGLNSSFAVTTVPGGSSTAPKYK